MLVDLGAETTLISCCQKHCTLDWMDLKGVGTA